MERSLLLFALFPVGLCAQQPAEFADQRTPHVSYTRVAAMGPDQWVFAGNTYDSFLTARNDLGEVLWDAGLSIPQTMEAISTLALLVLDDGLIAVGPTTLCDAGSTFASCIFRTDLTGQPIWAFPLDTMIARSVSLRTDGLMAFGDTHPLPWPPDQPTHILVLNADGSEHAYWDVDNALPRTVRWDLDNSLLALFDDILVRYTDEGLELVSVNIPAGALDLAATGPDSTYVLYSDRVVRYSSGFAALDSIDLSTWSAARWMEENQDRIWVTCADHFVAIDLADHVASGSVTEPLLGHVVSGTSIANGLIMTAGTASIEQRTAGVARSYSTTAMVAQHDLDVALYINSVDSVRIDTISWGNHLFLFRLWSTLRMENQGTVPITKVLLNYHRWNGLNCSWTDNSAYPDSLMLLPGESMLFTAPQMATEILYIPPGNAMDPEFCIVAISPNDLVDRDPTNNEACTGISFSNTTGLNVQTASGIASIAPQPFVDRFTVTLDSTSQEGDLVLIDASGREVHSQRFVSGKWMIEVTPPDLRPGIYVLQMRTGEHLLSRRLLKLP